MTPEKIAKLPRWAQDELSRLEQTVASLDSQLKSALDLNSVEGESDVTWTELLDPERSLPSRAHVRFKLSKNEYVDVFIRDERGQRVIDVNSNRVLLVLPRASNSIYLKVEGR